MATRSIDTGGETAENLARHSVLIVDDDTRLLQLLRNILRMEYEVAVAENGSDALDIAAQQHIDVIVMDLSMPVLDGPGLFRTLRERGDNTPVIVASSNGARRAQRDLGAEAFIQKPFDPDELLDAVDALLK